jgi:signal transduction histidine kinase/ActR/RegA family two-component response regulator
MQHGHLKDRLEGIDQLSTAQLIARQRIVSQYRMAPLPLIAGLAYCPIFVAALWSSVDHATLLLWAAARVASGALRLFDVQRFRRADPTAQQIEPWARRGLALLCVDAAVWAAIGPLFLTPQPGLQQTLVVATLIALPSIGALTLFAIFRWMAVFTVALLLPAIASFVLWNNAAGWVGAAGSAVLMAVLLAEGYRAAQRWNELQRLRYENARIAHDSRELLELAEQSLAAKTRFLATVSHELRTPLNGIMGMTQVLLGQTSDETTNARLQTVARSARHLRELIDGLIDLSRAGGGALALRNEPYALATAIHDVVQAHELAARQKGLLFHLGLPPDLPALVSGDATRVKQVLHNLIGNAIKFTPATPGRPKPTDSPLGGRERSEQGGQPGPGRVSLQVQYAGTELRFIVRDSGPGIAPEWAPMIFNAFEHYGQRRAGTGLGIGLAISREIGRSMGGDVVWESGSPGSVFVFTAAAPAAAGNVQAQSRARRRRFDGRALLVDDNAVNAEIAAALMRNLGFRVEIVGDGHEALARLTESRFDVVLMDCEMPQLDGYEATRRWRAIEQQFGDGRHVPIMALTANAVAGDRERCLEFGMDDYLAKPFEVSDLEAALERILSPG